MHHIHAIHQKEDLSLIEKTGVPMEPNLANVPKLAKVTEMKGTTEEVVHGSSSAYQIPGSLRMRPGMSSRSYMRPDWDSPVTGITKVPDHRRKFKINQFKKMMLVKDGKVFGYIICKIYRNKPLCIRCSRMRNQQLYLLMYILWKLHFS